MEYTGTASRPGTGVARRRPSRAARAGSIITPARVVFTIALIGSVAFILWGIQDRGDTQVPVLVTGLGILGITLGAVALASVVGAYRAGVQGLGARAFLSAFMGGVIAIMACGCLAAAVLLALVYRPLS
jgi:hypothetical protein